MWCRSTTVSDHDSGGGVTLRLDPHPDGNLFESVSLVQPDGAVLWTATPTGFGSDDAWTNARLVDDVVVAYTWSGYSVRLSLTDGHVLDAIFTK